MTSHAIQPGERVAALRGLAKALDRWADAISRFPEMTFQQVYNTRWSFPPSLQRRLEEQVRDRAQPWFCAARDYDVYSGMTRSWTAHDKKRTNDLALVGPDERLVTCSFDELRIWDVTTGKMIGERVGAGMICMAAPSSRNLLAGGTFQGLVRVDLSDLCALATAHFEPRIPNIKGIAIDAAGQLLLSGYEDGILSLWDVDQLTRLRSWKAHGSSVTAVSISADGNLAISASWDRTVALWDIRTQHERQRLTFESEPPISLAFLGNEQFLVGTRGGQLALYRVGSDVPVRAFIGHTNGITSLAVYGISERILSVSSDGTLRVWHPAKGLCLASYKAVPPRMGMTLGLNYDGSSKEHVELPTAVAASRSGLAFTAATDGSVKVWDTQAGQTVSDLESHRGPVHSVDISPDGQWAASTSAAENVLRLWDSNGRCTAAMPGADESRYCANVAVGSVAITADSKYAAAAASDGRFRAWNRQAILVTGSRGGAPPSWNIKSLSTGPVVAVAGEFGVVCWHIPTGNLRGITYEQTTRLAVSEDSILALVGGWDAVSLWDLPRRRCLASLPDTGAVNFLEIAHGIALCGCDGRMWTCRLANDVQCSDWLCYEDSSESGKTIAGEYGKGMLSGTILPGSPLVLAGLRDFRVLVASADRRQEMGYLEGHHDEVICVRALPDGRHVLTASADQNLRLWCVPEFRCVACYPSLAPFTCVSPIRSGRVVAGTGDGQVLLLDLAKWQPGVMPVRLVRQYRLAPRRWWDRLIGVCPAGSIDQEVTASCPWCGCIQCPPTTARSFTCRQCAHELRVPE